MQTQIQNELPTKPANYDIDPKKVDKLLPKLLNGEAYKLEVWLANLLSTGNMIDRERYDVRTTQFKKKDPVGYNTRINVVVSKLEAMRRDKAEVLRALADMKLATDAFYDKYKQSRM